MKRLFFKMNVFLSVILLSVSLTQISCSSLSSKSASQFQLRPMQELTLKNGLQVIYIKDTTLPRISFHLMLKTGAAQDPKGEEGLSNLTLALLEQGTKDKTATEIADEFAQLGSSFGESAAADYMMMNTAGLSEFKDKLISIYADVVMNPVFSNEEVARRKSQILADLRQQMDQPTGYADLLFAKEIYGAHPYGHPTAGTIASVKFLSRTQVIKNYFTYFRPNNAMLAIVGNFDEAFKAKVETTFSQWQSSALPKNELVEKPSLTAAGIKLFTKPGLQQTQIRIGQVGIARNDPDFLRLRLANVVLGGAFASRLNQKVRDDLGLTYSISSHFDAKKDAGSFEVSTFARNEKVGEAIRNTVQVIQEFQKSGVTEKELKSAKALLVGQFPAAIETADRLAFNLLVLRANGIPDTYLTQFFSNVNSITLKEVNETIRHRLTSDQLKTVVFADGSAVSDQLKGLGKFETVKAQ